MDIVTFVRDRLTERDERARAILRSGWVLHGVPDMKTTDVPDAHLKDAKRELRDVLAKRAIVDAYEYEVHQAASNEYWQTAKVNASQRGAALGTVLRLIATIDSDHPDYDESWRP